MSCARYRLRATLRSVRRTASAKTAIPSEMRVAPEWPQYAPDTFPATPLANFVLRRHKSFTCLHAMFSQ